MIKPLLYSIANKIYHWKEYNLPRGFERFPLKDRKKLLGAEIGVCRGHHAKLLLQNLDINVLYCIDPYLACPDFPQQEELDQAKREAKQRLAEFKNCCFIYEDSIKAASLTPQLDFVYIDGNHVYEAVRQDIAVWWCKVKPNGVLGGHDFAQGDNINFNGVIKAVAEFATAWNLNLEVYGLDWWVRKP